jgi:hypothetical protein
MWKQFPIVLDESCAFIFRFTLKMEAVDYMVSHEEDGILQYYCSCLCFFQLVTGCPGIFIVFCVFVHVHFCEYV